MIIKRTFLFLFLFILFGITTIAQNNKPIPEKGVLDLRGYDFSDNVELKGEWEFYWNKLYDYYDFENEVHTPDAYFNVPGAWTGTIVDGKAIPDTGFATFRLVIFVDATTRKNYMIYFGEILTAYKVWWNNDVLAEVGTVGKNSSEAKPALSPIVKSVDFDKEKIQLIIQISNYDHRSNGIFNVPQIGEESKIEKSISIRFFIDVLIFGAILIMFFYHIGLFLMRPKNKSALAFSLLTLVMALRVVFTGDYVLNFIFPDISIEMKMGFYHSQAITPVTFCKEFQSCNSIPYQSECKYFNK